jgi:rhodanese-related sulfurtransferase
MTPNRLSPNRVSDLLSQGQVVLVDVREPDEFARRHIKGARSQPLSSFDPAQLKGGDEGKTVVFTCRTGMRTEAHCERLQQAAPGDSFILEGGIDGWAAAGLPVEQNRKAPIEIMRQVQITAGLLVLAGIGLGIAVAPGFLGLAAFVGAGLTFAGVTGFCGMARVLALAPWNRITA